MTSTPSPKSSFFALFSIAALGTALVAWTLVVMFGRKQEARRSYLPLVELTELDTDPARWAINWPRQHEGYLATAGDRFYGGSSAMPASKLEDHPWLRRLYAGYAFSLDYREARGHGYMLYDQGVTERVTKKPQAGACLHCHASTSVLYRKVGLEAMGKPADHESLATSFDMDAVRRGFSELSRRPYAEVLRMLKSVPDGTSEGEPSAFQEPPFGGFEGEMAGEPVDPHDLPGGEAHPVSCIDCHDPKTMDLRITRPGFMDGIASLAKSEEPLPHLPSVERWRQGNRSSDYDPNALASRQEMRSFVCGQCHVEYYCANREVLSFPWSRGLRMEQEELHWEEKRFDNGEPFYDYLHGETGAPVFKVQHPEFELWNYGIHARSGVSCSDCHMPYQREGAMKLSSHDVRSPMETVSSSCQVCHPRSEADLVQRVETIQQRTVELRERAAKAMTDMLDSILEAKASGASAEDLEEIFRLQRKAMWRLDYISSENSKGFHADQEAARILGESIDYSRQAQVLAVSLRADAPPSTAGLSIKPVMGVSED